MLHGSYDPILVAISYLIAVSAGYTALDMTTFARETTGAARARWLLGAAIAMGGGIWSMHFVGMLALFLPIPISYDASITVFSLLLPVVVCGIGLLAVLVATPLRLAAAGLITGSGVVGMHYVGMAGMIMPATMTYDPTLVVASVVIGIVASYLSLWCSYRIRAKWQQLAAALVFGVAVTGMHYTGMAAAQFSPAPLHEPIGPVFNPYLLSVAVGSTTFLILLLCLISSMVQRRLAQQAREQSEEEAIRLEMLVRQRTADLTQALSQKDMFVKETHHRVKNNLNVILGLLMLGARDLEGQLRVKLDELANRIHSVSMVHEWLYQSDSMVLSLRGYLVSLLNNIESIYGVACEYSVDGDEIEIRSDEAVPIGLLCNEVITNAFKHAFVDRAPRIEITLRDASGVYEIRIRDFGIGLPDDFEGKSRSSVGIQLIRGLAKQAGGEVSMARHPRGGTEVILRIPHYETSKGGAAETAPVSRSEAD